MNKFKNQICTSMERINIAELLKDCPKGMELDCLLYDNVTFERFDVEQNRCYFKAGPADTFWTTCYGKINGSPFGKCIIFPKGKTTWEGFVPPCEFKDGDVLVHTQNERFIMSIYKSNEIGIIINTHVIFWDREEGLSVGMQICCYTDSTRFATEEEKEKLFDAIKSHGYKWNPDTKTLEKLPKFKVGDKIRHKINNKDIIYEISAVYNGFYGLVDYAFMLDMKYQDDYELVPTKFDINTLVPFDSRVLVRDHELHKWHPAMWGYYDCDSQDYPYKLIGYISCHRISYEGKDAARYCIPYEGNEHLLGTTNDCDEYYKTW